MPQAKEEVLLGFKVEADFEEVQKATSAFERRYKAAFHSVDKAVQRSQKSQLKATSGFFAQLGRTRTQLQGLRKDQDKATDSIRTWSNELRGLQLKLRDVKAAGGDDKKLRSDIDEKKANIRRAQMVRRLAGEKAADVQHEFNFDDMVRAAKEAGEELTEPLSRLMSKDLPGAFQSAAKIAGVAFGKAVGGAGRGVSGLGSMMRMGGGRMMKAAETSRSQGKFLKGAGQSALGGVGKVMGSVLKQIGPLLQSVAKIGPILGAVSGAIVGLVKLMIDAESAAKEFNKSVLQSTSITGFLGNSMDSSAGAAEALGKELASLRDSAMNLDNALSWGINKEQFLGVINTINQEGVALKSLGTYYTAARGEALAYAQDHKTMVQMVVAYSRLIGVSTQEIGSAQAEMMSEMGMGLSSVQESFYHITRSAEESGIASNKFFDMIRGVSADLSLFNFRMEDAAQLLGKLGQVMSPRNAAKFMQTAMNALKGMGRMQKIQVSMLAGPEKVAKIVKKDLASKEKVFAEELAKTVGKGGDPEAVQAFQTAIQKNDKKTISAAIAQAAPEQRGALQETMSRINLQRTRSGKGMVGNALAAGETSPVAQMEILSAAVSKFSGGKGLSQAVGDLGTEMLAENLGVSEEQLNQMAMFNDMLDAQRQELMDKATTDEEKARIAHADNQDLWDMLDKDTKESMLASTKQIDYAKRTSDYQTSSLDKMDMLMDILMNMIYNIMVKIYDSLADLVDWALGGKGKEKRDAEKMIYGSKDAEVIKAFEDAGGNLSDMKNKLVSTWGAREAEAEKKRSQATAALEKQLGDEKDPAKKGFLRALLRSKVNDKSRRTADLGSAIGVEGQKAAVQALGTKGKTGAIGAKVLEGVEGGKDTMEVLSQLIADKTFSKEDIQAFQDAYMGQALWQLDPKELLDYKKKSTEDAKEAQDKTDSVMRVMTKVDEKHRVASDKKEAEEAVKNLPDAAKGGVLPIVETASTPTLPSSETGSTATPTAPENKTAGVAVAQEVLSRFGGVSGDMGSAPPPTEAEIKQLEAFQEFLAGNENVKGTLAGIEEALKVKGIKINQSFLDSKVSKVIEDSTLKALRVALLEQALFMLSTTDPEKLKGWKDNMGSSAGDIFSSSADWVKKNAPGFTDMMLPGHAAGGFVTGVSNGFAQVSPAPGEGLASVGSGETIVPRGGGTQRVEVAIRLDGDMTKRLIKAQASNAIVEHSAAAPRR